MAGQVHRPCMTSTRFLERLVEQPFLQKQKSGRGNDYINQPLCALLAAHS